MSIGRAAIWVAATVLTPLMLYAIVSTIWITIWYWRTHHKGRPPGFVLEKAMLIAGPISSWATVLIWGWINEAAVADVFLVRSPNVAAELAIGLVVGVIWVLIYGKVVPYRKMFVLDAAKLRWAPAALSAGICEELLYRGFIIYVIDRAGGGSATQIVVSAIAFGLAHVVWGLRAMGWTSVLGTSLAVVTIWRGNVWAVIVAHSVLDLCIEPALARGFLERRASR